jgi:hypothetical protein
MTSNSRKLVRRLGTQWTISACILLTCILVFGLRARAGFTVASGTVIYRTPGYNYAPTVIQNGNVAYFWWCGYNSSINADSIWYASINLNTQTFITSPTIVLVPSYGAWDGGEVCDPTVIQGSFNIPGIGTATYAMYYGVRIPAQRPKAPSVWPFRTRASTG